MVFVYLQLSTTPDVMKLTYSTFEMTTLQRNMQLQQFTLTAMLAAFLYSTACWNFAWSPCGPKVSHIYRDLKIFCWCFAICPGCSADLHPVLSMIDSRTQHDPVLNKQLEDVQIDVYVVTEGSLLGTTSVSHL